MGFRGNVSMATILLVAAALWWAAGVATMQAWLFIGSITNSIASIYFSSRARRFS